MDKWCLLFFFLLTLEMSAQDKPYYYEIPTSPEHFTAAAVAARMVDGLGFRYFWATEGLREEDLDYRPTEASRSTFETLRHIEGLSNVLLNAVSKKPNSGGNGTEGMTFNELRSLTLDHIQKASDKLKAEEADLADFPMIFQRGDNTSEYPFWNVINGPLADALWHVGQVVSFRRSSGNPFPSGVSVLRGTKRD